MSPGYKASGGGVGRRSFMPTSPAPGGTLGLGGGRDRHLESTAPDAFAVGVFAAAQAVERAGRAAAEKIDRAGARRAGHLPNRKIRVGLNRTLILGKGAGKKPQQAVERIGTPGVIRTPDPLLRGRGRAICDRLRKFTLKISAQPRGEAVPTLVG